MKDRLNIENTEKQKATWPIVMIIIITLGQSLSAFGFERASALEFSQNAIGRQLDNFQLRDTLGNVVRLDQFRGKPLIISMIYTSCYHICPTTTKHLKEVVDEARNALGNDSFNVLTIGFDVFRDSPMMMSRFQEKQGIQNDHWQFLSTDAPTIDALAEQLGFLYVSSPHGFDHLIQATLIDKEGVILQQIYGMNFDMPLLIEPLKRLVFNKKKDSSVLTDLSHKILLFCTVYDPASNKYRFDYSLFIGMFIGFMSVFVLGITLIKEWRKTLKTSQ